MTTIKEVRQKYPQYEDMSDQQLAEALHQKFYSDLPFNEFSQKIGLQSEPPKSDWLRNVALGGRAAAEGVINTLGAVSDAQTNLKNAFLRMLGLPEDPTIAQEFSRFMDWAGAYKAETPGEELGMAVTRGVTGSLTGAGAMGSISAANAVRAGISGATGSASSEVARQKGVGPVGQVVAGIVGGAAPYAVEGAVKAGIRGMVRGGEAGRQRMDQNIQDFNAAGTTPSVGQAAGNRRMQATETLLSRTPGSAGPMARKAREQAQEIGARLDDLADNIAGPTSAERAGREIRTGVDNFAQRFRARGDQLYGELDNYVPPTQPVSVGNTQRALNDLTGGIPGAQETSALLTNPRLRAIREALDADLANTNNLPYEALKALRTRVGRLAGQPELVSEIPKAELRRLYGALSEDMRLAATAADARIGSNAASLAFDRANNYWRAGIARIDVLDDVVNRAGGPEAIFKAATSGTREGASTLRSVMRSLPQDAQNTLSATVIRRLGVANPSAQNAVGDAFSTETFLSNWNKLSPEAKRELFQRRGTTFSADMDRVARVAENLREGSKVFVNPSGTSQGVALGALGTAFFGSLFTGRFVAAGLVLGGVGGANLSARLMTNPDFVRWLARTTTVPQSALPALVGQLAAKAEKQDDPDLKVAAETFKAAADKQP